MAGGGAPAGPVTGYGAGDFHAIYDSDGTIGGGFGNKVGSDNSNVDDTPFGTVAGGVFNTANNYASTVAGGDGNWAGGVRSTILGGAANWALSTDSAVGGGVLNRIHGNSTGGAIAGGQNNTINSNAPGSSIGGGQLNHIGAGAPFAMIPGGEQNSVGDNAANAFAAGRRAKANHTGAFVWGDSTDADFASTANNQFLIRASGGVGIGTAPASALHVLGSGDTELSLQSSANNRRWTLQASGGTAGTGLGETFQIIDRTAVASRMTIMPNGNIGIGTGGATPVSELQVIGTVKATAFIGDGSQLTGIPSSTPPPGMALIPAGSFTMGDTLDGTADAVPVTANVSAFYMDVNEVSFSKWQSGYFWATNQGYGFTYAGSRKAANHPVHSVNWYDCVKWCNARSQQAGLTPVYYSDAGITLVYINGSLTPYANWSANGYRLPTEAEWEKAARGGLSGQRFPWGNLISLDLANYYGSAALYSYDVGPNGRHPVFADGVTPYTSPGGYFAPNGYGLNDMAGNVWEWCWDWYGTPYAGGSNPHGPASGNDRVMRGDAWSYYADNARCAHRIYLTPSNARHDVGFRCVRGL